MLVENHEAVVQKGPKNVSFMMAMSLLAGGTTIGGAACSVFLLICLKLQLKGKTNKKETKFTDFTPEPSRFLSEPCHN